MLRVDELIAYLKQFAPLTLAEDWDNVGLLVGDASDPVTSVMTCLTLTPDVAAEAIGKHVQLIVSHHPLLFRPVQRLTADTSEGRLLLDLIRARIAVYSPHTGFDSARNGINQQLAEMLDLNGISALRPLPPENEDHTGEAQPSDVVGAGRFGDLAQPMTLCEFLKLTKQRLAIDHLQYVGDPDAMIRRVGIACGSAAQFLQDAKAFGCEVLLTGEARFHACLEARTSDVALVLPGHYATERPAVERLAEQLAAEFPTLQVWPSQAETDPVQWG